MNCYSSIMAADSTSDNAAELSICSKVDHFYTCAWNSMVLGNETEFAHPHCSAFLENQTDSGSVEIMPKVTVTSNGYMDESVCQSDAKRKRNASSSKVNVYLMCMKQLSLINVSFKPSVALLLLVVEWKWEFK